MAVITYKGKKFEYDEKMITDYTCQKHIAQAARKPQLFFDAIEKIFKGRDEEYAEKLGGSSSELANLYQAALNDAGKEAKN